MLESDVSRTSTSNDIKPFGIKSTLPETNIAPENGPSHKEIHLPTSNHPFLGAILVSGRVTATKKPLLSPRCGWHATSAKVFALSGEHIRIGRWNALHHSDPIRRVSQDMEKGELDSASSGSTSYPSLVRRYLIQKHTEIQQLLRRYLEDYFECIR